MRQTHSRTNLHTRAHAHTFTHTTTHRVTAFQGTGQTLGGGGGASTSAAAAAPASSTTEWAGVDESQPTTSLQLRLADGSRMVGVGVGI